jgi:hypothetical protein
MAGADVPKAHGQRMRKLEHAYQRTVKYALRGIPPDDVFAYFPEGPLPDPVIETVYDAYRQVHNLGIYLRKGDHSIPFFFVN